MLPALEQRFFFFSHRFRFIRPFVVIAQNVEDAMRKQVEELIQHFVSGLAGLAASRGKRDDNLAELALSTRRGREVRSFIEAKAKRKHVGSFVSIAKAPIQVLHCLIIRYDNAECETGIDALGFKHRPSDLLHGPLRDEVSKGRLNADQDRVARHRRKLTVISVLQLAPSQNTRLRSRHALTIAETCRRSRFGIRGSCVRPWFNGHWQRRGNLSRKCLKRWG